MNKSYFQPTSGTPKPLLEQVAFYSKSLPNRPTVGQRFGRFLLPSPSKVYNLLTDKLRRFNNNMPSFIQQDWGDYKLRVVPSDNTRRFLRMILARKYDILPYFYGAYINFNLSLLTPKKKPFKDQIKKERINYEWRLCNRDETQIIKTGRENRELYI